MCTLTSTSLVCPSERSRRDHRSPAESNLVYSGRLFFDLQLISTAGALRIGAVRDFRLTDRLPSAQPTIQL